MFILCNKIIYYGNFAVLVPYFNSELISPNKHEHLMVKNCILCRHAVACGTCINDRSEQI